MLNRLCLAMLVVLSVGSCGSMLDPAFSTTAALPASEPSFWVRTVGDRRELLAGDLQGRIALDSLADVPDLYALGPVEGLQGEVTVYGGEPSIAAIENDGAIGVDSTLEHRAIFLVYASAPDWRESTIDRDLVGLEQIETYVREVAEESELDLTQSFPFRVEGRAESLTYHVIFKTGSAPHSRQEHHKAKQMFEAVNVDVDVIGFWMDEASVGAYTHPGKRTHLHALLRDRSASGHVDGLVLPAGARLFLPR